MLSHIGIKLTFTSGVDVLGRQHYPYTKRVCIYIQYPIYTLGLDVLYIYSVSYLYSIGLDVLGRLHYPYTKRVCRYIFSILSTCMYTLGLDVLRRQHYPYTKRVCVFLNVPPSKLKSHCRVNFPKDYFRYL